MSTDPKILCTTQPLCFMAFSKKNADEQSHVKQFGGLGHANAAHTHYMHLETIFGTSIALNRPEPAQNPKVAQKAGQNCAQKESSAQNKTHGFGHVIFVILLYRKMTLGVILGTVLGTVLGTNTVLGTAGCLVPNRVKLIVLKDN